MKRYIQISYEDKIDQPNGNAKKISFVPNFPLFIIKFTDKRFSEAKLILSITISKD